MANIYHTSRAERRRRKELKYIAKVKSLYKWGSTYVPIDTKPPIDLSSRQTYEYKECIVFPKPCWGYSRKAISWQDFLFNCDWIHKHKETGTVYSDSTYSHRQARRRKRREAKKLIHDILAGLYDNEFVHFIGSYNEET